MSEHVQSEFAKEYSEKKFWDKVQRFALSAGVKVVYAGLLLFYALREPTTPGRAKAIIIGALGYFISPLDAIIDITPIVGYADDLGVMVLALASVAMYINDNVRTQARKKLKEWFPNASEEEFSDVEKN